MNLVEHSFEGLEQNQENVRQFPVVEDIEGQNSFPDNEQPLNGIGLTDNVIFVDFNKQKPENQKNEKPPTRFDELTTRRLLTESTNLMNLMDDRGDIDPKTLQDIQQNLQTMTQEIGMPYAIAKTEHDVEYQDIQGRRQRIFSWLGKTAVQVATSGYDFHSSDAAFERVGVEIAEAKYAQDNLKPGEVQIFISPKMSLKDAPLEVAKREHLAEDDSIRIGYLKDGKRIMESMLIRDIPLQAWVAMLNDPNNIFGKSIQVEDPESALSVMKVFPELTLKQEDLKNGVLDIAEAAAEYIADPELKQKVEQALPKYQHQEEMELDAQRHGSEWLDFELELAKSRKFGLVTFDIKRFIYTNQHHWSDEDRQTILFAQDDDANFIMSDELAAVCENAYKKIAEIKIVSVHAPEHLANQVGEEVATEIQNQQRIATEAFVNNIPLLFDPYAVNILNLNYQSRDAGCAGGTISSETTSQQETESKQEKSTYWKKGVCRIKACSSRPGTTEVGPCRICKNCEAEFNAGRDPSKQEPSQPPTDSKSALGAIELVPFIIKKQQEDDKPPQKIRLAA